MATDFEHEFKTRKLLHLTALEESFQKLVDTAYDKEYASRAYCKTLFDPNYSMEGQLRVLQTDSWANRPLFETRPRQCDG